MPLCRGSPQKPVHQLCDEQDFGVTFGASPAVALFSPPCIPWSSPAGLLCPSCTASLPVPGQPRTYCRYEDYRLLFTSSIGTNTVLQGDGSVFVHFSFYICGL